MVRLVKMVGEVWEVWVVWVFVVAGSNLVVRVVKSCKFHLEEKETK